MGYHRAGFEIVGVDSAPQKNYPFSFLQQDVFELEESFLQGFDAIHASPPCQAYSRLTLLTKTADRHPRLIESTRNLLSTTNKPTVIENVVGAPLLNPTILCGTMFQGLRVLRHRLFETNFFLMHLEHPKHPRVHSIDKRTNHYGQTDEWKDFVQVTGGGNCSVSSARDAMGINWMTKRELNEAIPPAYTEYIGETITRILTN